MAGKRAFDAEEFQNNDETNLQIRAKRRQGDNINHSILAALETVLGKLLEEKIPPILERYLSPCRLCRNHRGRRSGDRALQLRFRNQLSPIIFTMANLTAEDGGPLQIELWDPASQQRFDTEEVSTMKAHIYVLDGDFGNEEWTAEEFKAGILKPREGKGPLLRGETIIRLVKGVGFINKKMMAITDNSRRTRSGKFRLGVKVEESNSLGAGIREAISEPFRVKDSRGESTKKPDRPSLNDKVWRLKHIGKGGPLHRQLSDNGIKTVKDLLRLNATGSLRENFGKINNWDKIIAHGEDCEVDDYERYSYEYHGMQLVFNCIYEVVEVIFHGQQHPRSLQSLDSQEKCLVERVKRDAYSNLQYLKPIETQTHGSHQVLPERLLPAQQGPLQTWPSTSTLNINEAANNGLVVNPDPLRTILGKMPLNMSFGGMVVPEEACTNIDGNEWDEIQSYFTPNPNPNPNPNSNHNQWEQPIYSSYAYGDNGAPCSIIFNNSTLLNNSGYKPSKRKTKTVWQKIRNALKWVLPHMAKRKRPILFCGQN